MKAVIPDNIKFLDNSIGLILTNLYFTCKDCDYNFHRLVIGIVRRVDKKLVISDRERPDRPFKVGKCTRCGSKDIYHVEFL
jgi:hypothetical protein